MSSWMWRIRNYFDIMPEKWQRRALTGAFIILQIIIWALILEIFWYANRSISDTPVYYNYAGRIINGMLPYRDFSSEYPPVAMLLFSLPRLFSGSSYSSFVILFEAEMLAFSCGIVVLLESLAWRQWHSMGKTALTLFLYSLFLAALGAIVKLRFDLAAAFIILASIACFARDRKTLAWMILGAGLMTKIIPVLIAPLFLISHYRRQQWKEMILGPLAAFLTAVVIAAPFAISGAYGLANSFLYHAERPMQLESTWASPLLIMRSFGAISLKILNSYGSHNVFSTGSEFLALISGPVTALLLLAGYLIFYKRFTGVESDPDSQRLLVRYAAVAIATFILGGKVFSPQFLIWLLPLMAIIAGRVRPAAVSIFLAVLLITQWEFPARYWNLFMLETDMIWIVAARNLLIAVLLGVLMLARENSAGASRSGQHPF